MKMPYLKKLKTSSLLAALIGSTFMNSCSKTSFSSGNPSGARDTKLRTNANVTSSSNIETPENPDEISKLESPDPTSDNPTSATPTPASPTPTSSTTISACVPNITAEMAEPVSATVTDINTASGLAAMTDLHRYRLTADIDLTGNWTPIPSRKRIYLDGNGHSIRGLNVDTINAPSRLNAGLFVQLRTSSIVNLKIVSPSIASITNAGVIAGKLEQSCLENVDITDAHVSAVYQAGSIAGAVEYGGVSIKNMNVSVVLVQGPNAQAVGQSIGANGSIGGLFGYLQNGGGGTNYINTTTLQFDISADNTANGSGAGSLIGMNQVPVQITDTTATGIMRCIGTICYRGGRYTSYFGPASTYPSPILQNTVVNLTRTGTWDNFKD